MLMDISEFEEDVKAKLAEELSRIRVVGAQEIPSKVQRSREVVIAVSALPMLAPKESAGFQCPKKKGLFFAHKY